MAEKLSRIKIEFNDAAANIVTWYAVNERTLRKAQLWQGQQKPTPAAPMARLSSKRMRTVTGPRNGTARAYAPRKKCWLPSRQSQALPFIWRRHLSPEHGTADVNPPSSGGFFVGLKNGRFPRVCLL